VERATYGADGLISCLPNIFVTFGIPDELASNGVSEFTATITRTFLQDWGFTTHLYFLTATVALK
jgi:hypothetical protein